MKKNKKLIRYFYGFIMVILAVVFLIVAFCFSASALTVDCTVNGTVLSDMPVNAYLIKDNHNRIVEPYSEYNIDFSFSTAEETRNLAYTLEAYTLYNSVTPTATALTDENGNAVFDNLEEGLYLILIPVFEQDGITYNSEPSLVSCEKGEDDEGGLTIIPKITPSEKPGQTLKVLKIWDDNEADRPESITVILLCDGKKYTEIYLSKENNWRHTFDNLSGNHHWTVVEAELEGYTVEIYLDGITFVIKNTKTDEPESTTKPDDTTSAAPTTKPDDPSEPPERLPQTGQLWWPVPIMFFLALLFIVIGLVQRKGEHYEK